MLSCGLRAWRRILMGIILGASLLALSPALPTGAEGGSAAIAAGLARAPQCFTLYKNHPRDAYKNPQAATKAAIRRCNREKANPNQSVALSSFDCALAFFECRILCFPGPGGTGPFDPKQQWEFCTSFCGLISDVCLFGVNLWDTIFDPWF